MCGLREIFMRVNSQSKGLTGGLNMISKLIGLLYMNLHGTN